MMRVRVTVICVRLTWEVSCCSECLVGKLLEPMIEIAKKRTPKKDPADQGLQFGLREGAHGHK